MLIAMIDAASVFAAASPQQSAEASKGLVSEETLDPVTKCAIGRFLKCEIKAAVVRGLFETELRPGFPENMNCREIDEEYAISYAYK